MSRETERGVQTPLQVEVWFHVQRDRKRGSDTAPGRSLVSCPDLGDRERQEEGFSTLTLNGRMKGVGG